MAMAMKYCLQVKRAALSVFILLNLMLQTAIPRVKDCLSRLKQTHRNFYALKMCQAITRLSLKMKKSLMFQPYLLWQ